ncbi:MAG: ATP synthase F0 subunit C [Caldimicrobium sp.]
MDTKGWVVLGSIVVIGIMMSFGSYGPARALAKAIQSALDAIARQPEAASHITRTFIIGVAIIESIVIYLFVIALILLFANPLLDFLK